LDSNKAHKFGLKREKRLAQMKGDGEKMKMLCGKKIEE